MNRVAGLVVTLAVSVCLPACGTPKQAWLATMRLTLPRMLCATDFFAQCFDWSAEECRDAVRPEFELCATELGPLLPASLGPLSGNTWGEKLGACTGRRVEHSHAERARFSPGCESALGARGVTLKGFRAEIEAIRAGRGLPPLTR